MQNPLVSIVIPAYNRANTIARAIDSAVKQTYKETEIIVVDDGSSDSTKETLAAYGSKIRYFWKTNGGASSARNYGIKESKGEYIAFLDSDDLWLTDKLNKQMQRILSVDNCGIAISDIEVIDQDNKHVSFTNLRKTIKKDGYIFEYILNKPQITCSYMLIRKDVFADIGVFDESISTAEDIDMMLRVCSKYRAVLVEEPLVLYKKSKNSLSNSLSTGNRLKVFDKISVYAPEHWKTYEKSIIYAKARIHNDYAEDLLWGRYIKNSQAHIRESLKLRFTARALVLYIKSCIIKAYSVLDPRCKEKEM